MSCPGVKRRGCRPMTYPMNGPDSRQGGGGRLHGATGLLRTYAAASLAALLLLGLVLAHTMQGQIRNRALDDARDSAQVVSRLGVLPLLTPADIQHGLTPRRLQAVNRVLRTSLIGQGVAAVRVWAPGERIVYANQ